MLCTWVFEFSTLHLRGIWKILIISAVWLSNNNTCTENITQCYDETFSNFSLLSSISYRILKFTGCLICFCFFCPKFAFTIFDFQNYVKNKHKLKKIDSITVECWWKMCFWSCEHVFYEEFCLWCLCHPMPRYNGMNPERQINIVEYRSIEGEDSDS